MKPKNFSDLFALSMTKFFRFVADTFFAKRYGHRAVVLETIAGVPGMVAGMLIHLKSLRKMQTGYGDQIREMLAESENERMHLMFFIEIAKPNLLERSLVIAAQGVFMFFYTVMYIFFPKTSVDISGSPTLAKILGNNSPFEKDSVFLLRVTSSSDPPSI